MPKIIMFLAFCQNWSQFYQVEAVKKSRVWAQNKEKSFTEHEPLGNNFGFVLYIF